MKTTSRAVALLCNENGEAAIMLVVMRDQPTTISMPSGSTGGQINGPIRPEIRQLSDREALALRDTLVDRYGPGPVLPAVGNGAMCEFAWRRVDGITGESLSVSPHHCSLLAHDVEIRHRCGCHATL